jgi:tetratricopeptide (TPR) repeat protein
MLAAVVVYLASTAFGFQQDEAQSETDDRRILTEAARLTSRVENLRDRMIVWVRVGRANWESGDSTSAKRNFHDALELIDKFPPEEQFADFYRQSVAEVQTELGDIEGADQTLFRIKEDSPQRAEAFRTVGLLQACRGDFKGAILKATAIEAENRDEYLESISKMQLEVDSVPGLQNTGGSSEAGDPCGDIAAADTINVPEDKATCLAYWGGQLASEGQTNTALEILKRALRESRLVLDLGVRAHTLEEIAAWQARAGSMNEATRTLSEAEPLVLAVYRNIKLRHGWTSTLQELLEVKVELGDFEGADSTLRQVEEGDRMNAVQGVARAVVAKGHKKEALAWATSQISSRDRALALVGISDGLSTAPQAADSRH